MFGNVSYLVYMLIFTLVPLGIVWCKYPQILMKNIKLILFVVGTSVLYQLLTDPFAEGWHAWYFSDNRILGIWLWNFPVENILFFMLVSATIASCVICFLYREGKKKS